MLKLSGGIVRLPRDSLLCDLKKSFLRFCLTFERLLSHFFIFKANSV